MDYKFTQVNDALSKRVRTDAHTSGLGSALYNIGSGAADRFNEIHAASFVGTATTATYADLAEKYLCNPDVELPTGSVMELATDIYECQICNRELSSFVLGVVSDKPAFLMNASLAGREIGLLGRLPVRIIGAISKRDAIVSAGNGCARKAEESEMPFKIGFALETNTSADEKLVECVIK